MRGAARRLLFAALLLGVAGDYLLREGMLRLGLTLFIALLGITVLVLGDRTDREQRWLILGTVLASCGFMWRDSPALEPINTLSVLCMGALVLWHGTGASIARLTILESARAAMLAVVQTVAGGPRLVQEAIVEHGESPTRAARLRAIAIGVVLAVPPLLLVAALLASSDAVFGGVLDSIGRVLAVKGLEHLVLSFVLAWVTAGWMRAALGQVIHTPFPYVTAPALPFLSLSIGLYGLAALLLAFLVTQARVLFGGETFLMATEGLTLAAYARAGFFEMVVAAAVVLGALVAAEWLLSADDVAGRHRYRWIGMVLIIEVAALLASATGRFALYLREFGLTVDRLMACAGIVWVTAALTAFALSTLRGRTRHFAPTVFGITVAWVMTLNIINPEAIVVRVNVRRAVAGSAFDSAYHASLSADALPGLLRHARRLPRPQCEALDAALRTAWAPAFPPLAQPGDWRSYRVPRARAAAWFTSGAQACREAASAGRTAPYGPGDSGLRSPD